MSDETTKVETAAKPEINISDILKMLKEGKERKEIGTKYGLNRSQLILLFDHPKLKGQKSHKAANPQFILVDDAPDAKEYVAVEKKPKAVKTEGDAPAISATTEDAVKTEAPAPAPAPAGETVGW